MSQAFPGYRSESVDFNEALLEQLRRSPWLLMSAAVHALVVVLLMLFIQPPFDKPDQILASMELEDSAPVDEEVPEPPVEDVEPDEPVEEAVEDVVTETTDDMVDESDNDSPYEEDFGESESTGEKSLTYDQRNDAIGLGGGVGGGSGRGGDRYGRRSRAPRQSIRVVMRGLEWLARHQSPDGSWDADGFTCQEGACTCQQGSRGGALYDGGVTGLALLAFLGAGESPRTGDYRKNVALGLRWLMRKQDGEGCFTARTTPNFAYNQAIATLAMIEAYELTRMPSLKRSAEKGLAFCLSMQNPYKAWRYGVATGSNDVSVTGWMVMVLKAASRAKLPFDKRSAAWARDFIVEMTSEETGRVGYVNPGEPTVREAGKREEFPASESEAMTAAGVCCRIFLGENPRESAGIKLSVENVLSKKLPVWDQARGSIDMYYWYYGTLAMFQVGGREWKNWERAMLDAIIERQHQEGERAGSWDPSGPWGDSGGRVYSTALMTMCMEVYYRYGRVFGT